MQDINLSKTSDIRRIHFTGIGGISMSGLAEILLSKGFLITGSDMKSSDMTEKLGKLGIKVYIGHSAGNISGADLVVYTAAVKENNPELIEARRVGIPAVDRAALLGEIMREFPHSIAISGTHGKTTTTSMISMIMMKAGLDPTIHIGGELAAIGGTTRIGSGSWFIAEACEYTGSFLKFHPYIAVILNIEFDHADYFRDVDHVRETFLEFARLVPKDGYLVVCADDPKAVGILDETDCNKVTYSLKQSGSLWSARDISFDDSGCGSYTLVYKNEAVADIKLSVPGIQNVSNSIAAIAACHIAGAGFDAARQALLEFTGTNRRFELKGIRRNIRIIDDYAHHPTEVRTTLRAAANCGHSRVWCIFQPHTYTRTKFLMDEFAAAFSDADKVIITDIYAAREIDSGEVHSTMLVERINSGASGGGHEKAVYIKSFDDIADYLLNNAKPGDLVITMGAGDIYKVGEKFLSAASE